MNKDFLCVEMVRLEKNTVHTSFPVRKLKRISIANGKDDNLKDNCSVSGDVIEMDLSVLKGIDNVVVYYYKDGGSNGRTSKEKAYNY